MGWNKPDIYYDQERFGLVKVAEIEWSEPDYSYDTTCAWVHPETGRWFVESDSGCSCPSPFEEFTDLDKLAVYDQKSAADELRSIASRQNNSTYSPASYWRDQVSRALVNIETWCNA